MSSMEARLDRLKIEATINGQTRVIELVARPNDPIRFNLDIENEIVEKPPVQMWRELGPTGRVTVRLEAYGRRAEMGA